MSIVHDSPAQVVPQKVQLKKRLLQESLHDEIPSDDDLQVDLDLRDYPLPPLRKLDRQPDFVIFVVNDDEMQAALRFLEPINKLQCDSFPAYFCTWPSLKLQSPAGLAIATVLLLQQGQSNDQGTHAAQALITAVLRHHRPRMIFALGCAYGWNAEKQKQFHVLLSEGFVTYHKVREGAERVNRNVVKAAQGFSLVKSGTRHWNLRRRQGAQRLQVHSGIIVSGDALVDSPSFKREVADLLGITEKGKMSGQGKMLVVGGEMEGAGLAAGMSFDGTAPLPWMLIKGVSDDGETKSAEEKKESDLQVDHATADGSQPNINQRKATFAAFHFLTFALKDIDAMGKMFKHMSAAQVTAATAGKSAVMQIGPMDNLYTTCVALASDVIEIDLHEAQYEADTREAKNNRASALEQQERYAELQERLTTEQEKVRITSDELDRIKAAIDAQFPLPPRCDADLLERHKRTKQEFVEQRNRYAPHTDTFHFRLPDSEVHWGATLKTSSRTSWSQERLQAALSLEEYGKALAGCQVMTTNLECARVVAQTNDTQEREQSEVDNDDEGEAFAHDVTPAPRSSSSGGKTPKSTKKRPASQAEVDTPASAKQKW